MFDHNEIIISSDNKTGRTATVRGAKRVVIPEFEVYKNPTIRLSDVKARRFNLIDRGGGNV